MQQRLRPAIDALASDARPPQSKRLRGRPGFRLRAGSFRVLYMIDDEARRVTITAVGPRKDVYRLLPEQ